MFSESLCMGCGACKTACKNGVHSFSDVSGCHGIAREKCISCGNCSKECPGGALELSAKEMSVDEIFREIKKDAVFFRRGGGVTLSGGEPLMQYDEAIRLLALCKQNGISTAVESCGEFKSDMITDLAEVCDFLLFDWKISDHELHKRCTGRSNENILQNLKKAAALNMNITLRCIIIEGINTCDSHYDTIAAIASTITNLRAVELLPYHRFGAAKALQLGMTDNTSEKLIPSAKTLAYACERISDQIPNAPVNIS